MSEENDKTGEDTDVSQGTPDLDRRKFLKLGAAGAAGAAAVGVGGYALHKVEGTPHDEYPVPVREDFKPIDQRDVILTMAASKKLNEQHPERVRTFDNFNFYERYRNFNKGPYQDKPGYTQLDRAVLMGGWSAVVAVHGHGGSLATPNGVMSSWKQAMLVDSKYEFESKEAAAQAIKSAARVYGALKCGITRRDRRFDYDPMYDPKTENVLTWEKDFPFEPKSVIVVMAEMDYVAMSSAPSWITDATVGDTYASVLKIAGQLAVFLRQLGYKAVGSLNDLGVNAPYAVAAGLGEAARNGQVITPVYGPRHRIAKVYTDFEFVEYDRPRTFGVASFCKNCKRCADACPGEAITHGDQTWEPEYSKDPEYTWNASPGIYKFHNDAKKCFRFWLKNDGGCANCICSCPYNKPDFWHHRMIDAMNVISPGPMHSFMKEMDRVFGYGSVDNPAKVKKFWSSGEES
jgi:reductive dehalogenase